MKPEEAGAAAVKGGRASCQVCGRDVAVTHSGQRLRAHNMIMMLNPDAPEPVTVTSPCLGSGLPAVEYAEAFDAARKA